MKNSTLGVMMMMLAATGVGAVTACSSDSTSPAPVGTTNGTTTVHITAAQGGTVSDPGGTATLKIPAGSLEKDTDITLKLSAAGGQAVTQVYEFGPDGTKFTKPATLEIKADAKLAPEGKTLAVAMGTGTTFTPLEGSTYANGVATGAVAHFTSFTVMVVDGKLVVPPTATCTDLKASFVACGGDPKGTWTYDTYCPPPTTGNNNGSDPFNGRCKGWSITADLDIVADVTIDATTITSSGLTLNGTAHYTVPISCMNDLPDGGTYDSGINDCPAIQKALFSPKDGGPPDATCVDESGICKCTGQSSQSFPADPPQTYTINGNSITSTDSKGKVTTSEYCVKGDIITSRIAGATPAEDTYYTLKRK